MADLYLTEGNISKRFGIPSRTLQRWRVTGDGPPYTRIGPRRILYPVAAFEAWLSSRTYAHRAEEMSRTGDAA